MKIGLFFGSFNPIHIGHLVIANIMAENTDLDQVWFVVSPQNPFKKNKSLLHEQDRMDMVKAAVGDNYKLQVSDVEFQMPRPSYTIDTLVYLQEKFKDYDFALIIGEDNLQSFPKWKNSDQILQRFPLYVYPRPDCNESVLKNHPGIKVVKAPLMQISATEIRNMIKNNKSIRYLVTPEVEGLIKSKGFYS